MESSSGGLLSAALLAVPGASAYFLAGAVVYTHRARKRLLDIPADEVEEIRSASEPYALLLARTTRERFSASWGLAETGAAGPTRVAIPRHNPLRARTRDLGKTAAPS